ncbi:disease resistance protein At4g27190-like [Magnolia sinica]|uniref:disease resistance protein At4g27190-like n=1 Tax=Magnolia sinica TaxID=86752 RepID=UPI002658E0C5|nr:disease resistance protein At4g27190-like [Magnolia sinica]
MEAAVLSVVEMGKCAWNPLQKHTGYLNRFNDNIKDLKDHVEDLEARREHIDQLISMGCSNGEEEIREVRLWLMRAVHMKEETELIEQRVAENKRCLFCPNISWRYSISKQAKKMTENIAKHLNEGNFERVTMPPLILKVINQPAPSIEGLRSVESSLEKVMNALGDENIKRIGVWGMGGVGKTTLVKNMNNRLERTQQFNKVIMVTVSKDVDIRRVQGDIADRLELTLKKESSRASDLSSRLMKEKKFLIILDDLWERLDLDDVGIPSTDSLVDCKIIFTTRSEDVCREMESHVNIKVDVLSNDESWKLFKEKAGDVVDEPSLHIKAREVFKECGGLPLAIITLGRAMRGVRNLNVWDNALSQLKKSAPTDIKGMEDRVYQSIKVSYDHLRPELKPGFLFCCLFPEDYDIDVDRMIRLWKGEGFLEDVGSLEEMINKGHSWVEKLKSSCLLLEGEGKGYVRMHDIVRDVAISISLKEDAGYKSLVRAGVGLKGLSHVQNWEEYKRISLMRSGIDKLPEGMHYPKLQTLMMLENKELTEIQGGFLEAMKELRVLDLSETTINRLPSPLSNLVNLRVLCMRDCMFEASCLSALGGLKNLESLDLSYNKYLQELPIEIGELVNLWSLDLTWTTNLVSIPSGVISRLARLEELKMWKSFSKWEVEGKEASSSSSNNNATLGEVASLKELSYLHLQIGDVDRFPQDYHQIKHWRKLQKFRFCIYQSGYEGLSGYYTGFISSSLRWMVVVGCSCIPEWIRMLLPHSTHLQLYYCKGLRSLGGGGGFPNLEKLEIWKCVEMEFVISAKESSENAFGNLQRLELIDLPNLKKVVSEDEEGLLPPTFLHNLRNLEVYECPKLKHLLSFSLLQGMENLSEVQVWWCEGMEHVFAGPPVSVQNNDVLTKLKTLNLADLRSMTSIWGMGLVVNLQNLTTLMLSGCHGLKKIAISTMQMKSGFPNLVELAVDDCQGVEEIISNVVDNEGLLPKLTVLRLLSLPELASICGGTEAAAPLRLDWHSLEEIQVDRCPKLKKLLPLQGGAHGVPSLRKIAGEREWWEGLEWDEDHTVMSYFRHLFTEV